MFYILLLLFGLYALACLWLWGQWHRLPQWPVEEAQIANPLLLGSEFLIPNSDKQNKLTPYSLSLTPYPLPISVIIAVRNEAAHIGALLNDLNAQTLPKNQFEVIIADDASTDDTALIIKGFQDQQALNLTLVQLPNVPTAAPKKRAIAEALRVASGGLIVTTDGDCRVGADWLQTFAQTYAQTGAKFISGPVSLTPQLPFYVGINFPKVADFRKVGCWAFGVFQTIEFASLIGTGACLIAAQKPTMCNGANLAFERATFDAVGGYAGTDHVASGDDELLMHKIAQRYPNGVVFLKNTSAIVSTWPQDSWRAFYAQRVRWGSKWAVNGRWATMLVAVFVFLVNGALVLLPLGWGGGLVSGAEVGALLVLKYLPEFAFLSAVLAFLGHRSWRVFVPFVQLVYPFYVLFFGIAAQQKGYVWKGRRLR